MNWEYLIGSEKDFEGAPDWCTQCVWTEKDGDSFIYWLNPETKTIYSPFWHMEPTCWNEEYGLRNYIKAERQAITALSWDGAGLPPVGCECEALIPHGAGCLWRRVKVICSGDEFKASGELIVVDLENTHLHWTDEFRPLRSEHEIKVDGFKLDLLNVISMVGNQFGGIGITSDGIEAISHELIMLGYEKTK